MKKGYANNRISSINIHSYTLLFTIFLILSLSFYTPPAYPNHPDDDPFCPDTHTYGGESLTTVFTDENTGEPITDGMIFTSPVSINVAAIATAYGSCEKYISVLGDCVLWDTYERAVGNIGRKLYRDWNGGNYYELTDTFSYPRDPTTGQITTAQYFDSRINSTAPSVVRGLGKGINRFTISNGIDWTICHIGPSQITDTVTLYLRDSEEDKNLGCSGDADTSGNPCNITTGNKHETETDYISNDGHLKFTRYYNSQLDIEQGLGTGWTSNFHNRLDRYGNTIRIQQANGRAEVFTLSGTLWQGDPDSRLTLTEDANGYTLELPDDSVESYDSAGRLLTITTLNGVVRTASYDASGKLDSITTNTGLLLSFTRNTEGQIETLTDDRSGRVWTYRYDTGTIPNLEYVDNPDGTTRQYHYEDANHPHALTGITDERGNRYATFAYDSEGRNTENYHGTQTSVLTERAEGISITYNPDGTRNLTNSNGNTTAYTTATQLGVSHVTDISGPGCVTCGPANSSYNYDPANNNLLTVTDNGVLTEYGGHDANGNPGFMIEAKGTAEERRTDYTYDNRYFSRIATMTEPSVYAGSNKVTTYGYDAFGNRTSETISGYTPTGTPISRTTAWQYNGPFHQLSQIDGPRTDVSDITTLRYYPDDPLEGNNRARLKEIEDANGVLVRGNIQYTTTGKMASESRPNGLGLAYTYYPGNDRLETLTESDGTTSQTTRWTYLATGEVASITTADSTPDATTVTFTYDDARRLVRMTDGLGNYIAYTLDTEGNVLEEKTRDPADTLTRAINRSFDSYNHLDLEKHGNDPLNPLETVDPEHNPNGTLAQSTDGANTVTGYGYDALKRRLSSTQDLGGTDPMTADALTQYGYDTADRLTSVTDPISGTTTYVYDDLGNRLQTVSPDTGTTTMTYDAAGNLKSRQDALGQLFLYSYDALNRLTGVDAPGSDDDIIYGYDTCTNGTGRLCSVIPPSTIITYAYDAFGNVTSHQGLSYSHDDANRLKTLTYPSGAVVTYAYDAAGQVSQVDLTAGGSTQPLASNITYAPLGGIETLTYGNGLGLTQQWDSAYRLTGQSIPGILGLGYTGYDANGNLETRTDSLSSTGSFAYDALNRLDTATGPFSSQNLWDYGYDRNGNRTLSDEGTPVTLAYETNSNRLDTIGADDIILDLAGNTLAKGNWTYAYTTHHRLKAAFDTGTSVATYAYNGLGQRIRKTLADGTVTEFLYGTDGALLAERDGTGAVLREYVYLNGQVLAVLDQANPQNETVQDNGEAGTGSTGTWTARTSGQAYGSDYLLATKDSVPSTYRWTPILTAGTYEVYAWWVSSGGYSASVPYTIVHDGQTDAVTRSHRQDGSSWQLLGTWSFNGSGAEYIKVSNANGKASADAVKFVQVGGGSTTTTVSYVHNDHLGTPQVMTDDTGTEVWRATYDPFGKAVVSGTQSLNVRFPGQYYDQETALHYNYFRTYDPETGRYLTSDPIGLQGGLNTYGYAYQNPLSYIDPTGETPWGLIFAGADLAYQLYQNGGRWDCVNYKQVGLSLLGGGLLNGLAKGAFRFKTFGSHTWGATKQWMRNRNIMNVRRGQDRHHAILERNQGIGQYFPDAIKNQPWNLNVVSSRFNNWMGRNPWRAPLGAPSWMPETIGGAAMAAAGNTGDDCGCEK